MTNMKDRELIAPSTFPCKQLLTTFIVLGITFALTPGVTSERTYRIGILENSVDSETLANNKFLSETIHEVRPDRYMSYEKAHKELKSRNLSALIGYYNEVYATVAESLKLNYYVTTILPRGSRNSNYTYQLFPSMRVFTRAVFDLVNYYSYRKITVVHDSDEGAMVLEKLLGDHGDDVSAIRLTENTSLTGLRRELKLRRERFMRVFIVICSKENTDRVLRQSLSLGMFSPPNKWLLVNTALELYDLSDFVDSRANLTVLRLMTDSKSDNCTLNVSDINLKSAVSHDAVLYCLNFLEKQKTTKKNHAVRTKVNKMKLHGCTGYLEFNKKGKRKREFLQLMTLQAYETNKDMERNQIVPVIQYDHLQATDIISGRRKYLRFCPEPSGGSWNNRGEDLSSRVHPSKTYSRVVRGHENVFGNKPMEITLKIEPPFVQEKKDAANRTGNDKYEGHLIDIIEEVAKLLKFEYNLSEVPDKKFGSLKPPPRGWTGMIRLLVDGKADIALAPFQMSPKRSEVVDFSKPFMTKGTTVVVKRPERRLWIFQFLSPLSKVVWSAIFVCFVIVSLTLFGVSRVNSDKTQRYTNNLRESFWYIWGTLLRGSLTGSPNAISSRIISSAWWFFSLIVISIYTANLAAFLTITISNVGISSAADLANQDYFEYGTVDGSQIESFFKQTKMDLYAKMGAHMLLEPESMVRRVENGFEEVRKGKYAFIWDSPTIRHETSEDCDLMEIGHPFDLKGYGIAYTKNAPFGEKLSWAILKLNDEGIIYRLEGKWWRRQFCPDQRSSAQTQSLDIENVAGMFLVLLGGIVISCIICLFQYCLTKGKPKKEKSTEGLNSSRERRGHDCGRVRQKR